MTAPESDVETTEATGATPETAGENLDSDALRAELARARSEAAKYRQRAREFGDDEAYKRAKDAVAAVEKAEQEKKTEVEKLTERSEGLLHRATSAEQELAKLRVALGAGVDPSQVDEFSSRLRGDTTEELQADAEQLARFFNAAQTPPRRSDPSQGAGGDVITTSDPLEAALIDKIGLAR